MHEFEVLDAPSYKLPKQPHFFGRSLNVNIITLRNKTPAFLTRAHRPQALPRVKPGLVAVVPDELEGVLAGGFEPEVVPPHQGRSQENVRVWEVAHVFMAPAGGARTGAAQPVERIDGAVAVRPIDREHLFVFDHREATGRDFRIHAA